MRYILNALLPLFILLSFTSSISGKEFMAQRKFAFHVLGSGLSTPGWYFPTGKGTWQRHESHTLLPSCRWSAWQISDYACFQRTREFEILKHVAREVFKKLPGARKLCQMLKEHFSGSHSTLSVNTVLQALQQLFICVFTIYLRSIGFSIILSITCI